MRPGASEMARSRGTTLRLRWAALGVLFTVAGPQLTAARTSIDDGNECATDVRELCIDRPECTQANVRMRVQRGAPCTAFNFGKARASAFSHAPSAITHDRCLRPR